ncbi:GntR family transcriptional regulator [Ralstonia sp. CHL-2022]|uniref:GntR family transcriptional regulator n=1 Tax=Ralstonia mojiangensis TaxID=2953895 RepID=A0ABT2LDT6_9RALS|nr:GntR family transcriptional regulator [Ralstonia mojiangensis]MCT7294875.1 GntR family transcriptional regulator [Ralstonia mojiangensis]MCT7313082.1 GntR family transcriptional regulator [Ralstonia mojiangensis]
MKRAIQAGVAGAQAASTTTVAHAEPEVPRTLCERAYLDLRQDIIQGRLAPGERLRVEHLKDRYNVGAGTLREALALLVSDALVTVEGQRGYRVTGISLADLQDLTDTRVMLETEAVRLSIRHGDAQWEAHLRATFDALSDAESLGPSANPEHWERANRQFHEALIAAHRSPWSKYLLDLLYRHGERYRRVAIRRGSAQPSSRNVHEEHTAIFEAAMARQEARAALAVEVHIRLTYELLAKLGLETGTSE